jgi:hypothetical protein
LAAEALPCLPSPQRRALEVALLLPGAETPPEARAVGMGLVEVLRAVARAGGAALALALDDLQWLDVPSEELLEFALCRLEAEPVRVLCSGSSHSDL